LRDQDYYSAATQNVKAVIESGTTCVGEICTQGASPDILKRSGMRARIFHEIIDMSQNVDPGVRGGGRGIFSR
jgi:hypothetical protein